jgi:oligo-1,6-glucosidase
MRDLYPNDEDKLAFARKVLQKKARDHSRTPVQWSAAPNAGFCAPETKPWMRVNDDYATWNATAQREFSSPDQLSVLQFWKRGLENRKKHKDCFVYGDFELLKSTYEDVFAYRRQGGGEAFVTVLNFSGKEIKWEVPEHANVENWVAGNYTKDSPDQDVHGTVVLRPWEGLLGMYRGLSVLYHGVAE